VNELLENVRAYLAERTPRERWLMVLAGCVLGFLVVFTQGVVPLQNLYAAAEKEISRLELDELKAARIAREVQLLRGQVVLTEAKIKPGESTNLFTLLESMASDSSLTEQLESIKPKQPSKNPDYPETRVEVQLKGATLEQTVTFLYRIEHAPVHLIVRSIRLKKRADDSKLLDVSFSVSSFRRV